MMPITNQNIQPIKSSDVSIFFDLHGVLISKKQLTTKYDEFIVKFIKEQEMITRNNSLELVKKANSEWTKYWMKAKELPEGNLVSEYEKANALWAKTIFQGNNLFNDRQTAEFLEYLIPTQYCCLYPEIKTELEKLKKLGAKLHIASSAHTRHTLGVLVGCRILKYFDKLLGLENTKSLKSNINYYKRALDIASVQPHRAIFFGNSSVEIELPKSLGCRTIFVKREIVDEKKITAAMTSADLVVNNLENITKKLLDTKIIC